MLKLMTCLVLVATAAGCTPKTMDGTAGEQAIPHHRNDRFAHEALGFEVSVENIKSRFGHFKTKTTPMPNQHAEGVVDTIYVLSSGKTGFVVYRARHRDMLLYAHLETGRIELKNGIRRGMSKPDFENQLGLKLTTDRVRISDKDNTATWTFNFRKGKLKSIDYEGYVD